MKNKGQISKHNYIIISNFVEFQYIYNITC